MGTGKDPIIAIGDGYISRISLKPDGYGRAIYIDHPCGRTSVYAHLDSFSEEIQDYVDQVRMATKKSEIDQNLPPNALRLSKGDTIGTIGNSGNSFGAHLHFEIRNTNSEVPINPVIFGIGPMDNIPPAIKGLVVYKLDFSGKVIDQQYFPSSYYNERFYSLNIDTLKISWPRIGFGLHVYDTSNGASNHNGIHKLKYQVNGDTKFAFSLDSIPFDKSIFLHAHMDYEFKKNNQYVHKCYKEKLNTLDLYSIPSGTPFFAPNTVLSDKISIIATDIFGNLSSLNFIVSGSLPKLSHSIQSGDVANIVNEKTSLIAQDSFTVSFPNETFLHPENIDINAQEYQVEISAQGRVIPFFKNAQISYRFHENDPLLKNSKKATYITTDKRGRKINIGGYFKNKVFTTSVNELGIYEIRLDTISPTISIIRNSSTSDIVLKSKDNYTTSGRTTRLTYSAEVDGKWVPVDYDEKNDILRISRKWLKSGSHFTIKVSDFNQNENIKEFTIN